MTRSTTQDVCTRCWWTNGEGAGPHCGRCWCCTLRVASARADQPAQGQLLQRRKVQVHTVETWEDALTGRPVRLELRPSTLPPDQHSDRVWSDTLDAAAQLQAEQEQAADQRRARFAQAQGFSYGDALRAEARFSSMFPGAGGAWRLFDPGA